jgi:uncharacterized protein YjbI with pentapeptide repeats
LFDVYLVWKLRLGLKENARHEQMIPNTNNWLFGIKRFFVYTFYHGWRALFAVIILAETILTGFIALTPDDWFLENNNTLPAPILIAKNLPEKLGEFDPDEPPWVISILIGALNSFSWFLPRIEIDPTQTVWNPNIEQLKVAAKLEGYNDWHTYFLEKGEGFRPAIKSLRFANLSGQNLLQAQFQGCRLQGSFFLGANLQKANFTNNKLYGVVLDEANLQGAIFKGAQLKDAKLRGANLQGLDLSKIPMDGIDLGRTPLKNINLAGAKLKGANFDESQLQGANLKGAQLQGASLNATQLQGAQLQGAQLQRAELREAHLEGANLKDAQLQGTQFDKANLQGAVLENAQLQGANLTETGMQGANLKGAQLQGSSLNATQLQGANLHETNVDGALLYQTNVTGAKEPRDSNVVLGANPMLDNSIPDWRQLEQIANDIPGEYIRDTYLSRIQEAKTTPISYAEKVWKDDSVNIAVTVLTAVCNEKESASYESRVVVAESVYHNYWSSKFGLTTMHLQDEVKRNLCTLPACSDLRDKIYSLDCNAEIKYQTSPE